MRKANQFGFLWWWRSGPSGARLLILESYVVIIFLNIIPVVPFLLWISEASLWWTVLILVVFLPFWKRLSIDDSGVRWEDFYLIIPWKRRTITHPAQVHVTLSWEIGEADGFRIHSGTAGEKAVVIEGKSFLRLENAIGEALSQYSGE